MLSLLLCALTDPAALLADLSRALAGPEPYVVEARLTRARVLTWQSHVAEGTVRVDPSREAFRVDATVRAIGTDESHAVTLWKDGDRFAFADHGARTVAVADRPVIGGLASRMAYDLGRLLPARPETLAAEGDPKLRDPLVLGEERCHALVAKTPDGPTAHVWYLAVDDGLPRLWETTRELGGGDGIRRRATLRGFERAEWLGELDPEEAFPEYRAIEPVAWDDPEGRARAADAGAFSSLADGLGPLRERFNAARDHVRAVGLFAPT